MSAAFRFLGICAAIATVPLCASAQRYVISARPGALNYVEGSAFINGQAVADKRANQNFLRPKDEVSTTIGNAEILLIPGTFLRIGNNSSVRMVALSLTDIQVRVQRGEAMLEVDELTKENSIRILPGDGSGSVQIRSPGLYRFTANGEPTVAVIKGKAELSYAGRNVKLGNHHEVALAATIEKRKFDKKKEDDLYAWSNARSEYESAASYQTAASAWQNRGLTAGLVGFGAPGWAWNPMFSSWAWLPGANMAFFSPFGYGFFAPAIVASAPICYAYTNGKRWTGPWHGGHRGWIPIAVNPAHPPATGSLPRSVAEAHAASVAARRSFAASGFRTASGSYVPVGSRMLRQPTGPQSRSRMGAGRAWAHQSARQGVWSHQGSHQAVWSHQSARPGGWSHPAGSNRGAYSRGSYSGGGGEHMSSGMSRGSSAEMSSRSSGSRAAGK